jgi:hypothetical protein
MHHLHAYLENVYTVIKAQFICNLSLKDIHMPAMFIVVHTFALLLSLALVQAYLKRSNRPHKPLVLWTVQMLDQLSILLTHLLWHTKNTYLLTKNRFQEVATDKFVKAYKLFDKCVRTLHKFVYGTDTIPSCPLLQADEAKATKAKLDKALKRHASSDASGPGLITPDTKCRCSAKPGDSAPSAEDFSGTLIYTGTDMMPTVNNQSCLCLFTGRQRVGCNCPCSTSGMMIHELDIAKWTDTMFTNWSVLVDKTPALEWNLKVSSRNIKLSASSLANRRKC